MAYVLLSQSFGAAKANLPATITEAGTGLPAVILSSATGGLVNSNGDIKLDSSGNLSCYVDGAKTWVVNVDSGASAGPVGLLTGAQVAAGATAVVGVKSDGTLVEGGGATIGLTPAQVVQTQALLEGGGGGGSLAPLSYSASRTLTSTDAGRQLRIDTTAGAVVLTIPNDATTGFVGSEMFQAVISAGSNPLTYAAGSGLNALQNPNTAAATIVGQMLFATRAAANTFVVSN